MADQSIDSSPIMIQRGLTQFWPLRVHDLPERAVALDPLDVARRLGRREGGVDRPEHLEVHRAEAGPDRAALVVGQQVAGQPDLPLRPATRLVAQRIGVAEPLGVEVGERRRDDRRIADDARVERPDVGLARDRLVAERVAEWSPAQKCSSSSRP